MHLDLFVDLAVRIQRTSDSSMELKSELFLLVRMSDRCWFGSWQHCWLLAKDSEMSIFDGYNLTFVKSAALYTVLAHSFTERNDSCRSQQINWKDERVQVQTGPFNGQGTAGLNLRLHWSGRFIKRWQNNSNKNKELFQILSPLKIRPISWSMAQENIALFMPKQCLRTHFFSSWFLISDLNKRLIWSSINVFKIWIHTCLPLSISIIFLW